MLQLMVATKIQKPKINVIWWNIYGKKHTS